MEGIPDCQTIDESGTWAGMRGQKLEGLGSSLCSVSEYPGDPGQAPPYASVYLSVKLESVHYSSDTSLCQTLICRQEQRWILPWRRGHARDLILGTLHSNGASQKVNTKINLTVHITRENKTGMSDRPVEKRPEKLYEDGAFELNLRASQL